VRPSVSRLQVRFWGLLATVAAVAAVAGRPGVGGVVLGGSAIGLALLAYAVGLGAVLRRGSPRLAIGLLSVKLLAFLGLGWFAFHAGAHGPDPVGFAIGVSCLPVAAVWEALSARGSDTGDDGRASRV
jgi:hypothetical protein